MFVFCILVITFAKIRFRPLKFCIHYQAIGCSCLFVFSQIIHSFWLTILFAKKYFVDGEEVS